MVAIHIFNSGKSQGVSCCTLGCSQPLLQRHRMDSVSLLSAHVTVYGEQNVTRALFHLVNDRVSCFVYYVSGLCVFLWALCLHITSILTRTPSKKKKKCVLRKCVHASYFFPNDRKCLENTKFMSLTCPHPYPSEKNNTHTQHTHARAGTRTHAHTHTRACCKKFVVTKIRQRSKSRRL